MKLKTNKNRPSYEIHGTEILLQIDQPRKLDLKKHKARDVKKCSNTSSNKLKNNVN